ncbi:MAG: transcription antitermination factor NusB [Candidatus Peribacteraceae bacterium]|jgi:N utilization substance protein B|nr:transcription antitermination factor NusB [Candidatus Peribacteraceae bacterium]MDP7454414.1 transcription antitermination factor NusB [Candidatus Peribacteraceae bacterium]MDP7645541.1 transcription antitermination factor NusB [Candidatus Peribacteraceae bacterium]|tara:strand:- start:53 stop:448 length:396 start_codon:yes stop_codon:yes gene_type:complete
MPRKRHLSRIAVVQTLFEVERREVEPADSLSRNVKELGEIDEEFALELLAGVTDKKDEIIKSIEENAPEWSFERMDPIARCVLLVGAYELLFNNDAPPAVVMDESIEIAKEYGTDESGKFVNGVLNAMAKK